MKQSNEAETYLRSVQETIMEVTDEEKMWQKMVKPYFKPLFPSVFQSHAHNYIQLVQVWAEIEDNI